MTKQLGLTALAATLIFAAPAPAPAQQTASAVQPPLTVERLYQTSDFRPDRVSVRWLADGQSYAVVEAASDGTADLVRVDARTGDRETLVRGSALVPPGTDEPLAVDDFEFSADESKLLFSTNTRGIWRYSSEAEHWVWDLDAERMTPVSREPGAQKFAKLSADGSRVAFVRANNIYVTNLASAEEVALTTDGDENIINGGSDWVYEEELELFDGLRWSPDGNRIAFWRFDQSAIPAFYLLNELSLYPELRSVRYPKAGTTNSTVRLGVIDVATREVSWIDTGADADGYIARMDFAGSADELWIQTLNRHQNRMELKLADLSSGRVQTIMTDRDEAWLDINEPTWIDEGRRFVYLSERDGNAHLYLYRRDGRLERKLTDGRWDVASLVGVDDNRRAVYFTGHADGPLARPLYRVGLDGRGMRRLSAAEGRASASFDPTFTYYVETHSRAGEPPVQSLRTAEGEAVRTLTDNGALSERLESLGLNKPEFMTVPVGDGVELNAWMIKPPDFDPTQSYPLLMYVYGGPGSQTVRDSWGGDRYMWHQVMAQHGYLVASVDNRGTGARGAAFKKLTYLNLGAYESDDQIAAARHFASLPYVDGERIGIWGWSYGGYMTALSVFRGADTFKAGISVAPVTDWRLYDTIYTERFMRTPQENPEGYARSAPAAYASQLESNFLLVHGTGDDNVHPQNSTVLVQSLIEANKQFDLRLYPNKAHSISGSVERTNLFTMMTEFLLENL